MDDAAGCIAASLLWEEEVVRAAADSVVDRCARIQHDYMSYLFVLGRQWYMKCGITG